MKFQIRLVKALAPGRPARLLLHIQMTLILLSAMILLITYQSAIAEDPIYANSYYPALAEYLFAGVASCAGSVALTEAIDREGKQEE